MRHTPSPDLSTLSAEQKKAVLALIEARLAK